VDVREYSREELYWVWLNRATGHNVRLFDKLTQEYDSPEQLFNYTAQGKAFPDNIPSETVNTLKKTASEKETMSFLAQLSDRGIECVTRVSCDYPVLLKEIADAPSVLYIKGRLNAHIELPLAVIGSRKCTAYGRDVALKLSSALAEQGICVISGLAYGIDAIAAEGALSCGENEYPTVAVLGCGVDVIYPSSNTALYEKIIERGAVISEFLPGTKPLAQNFPIRNRIISGLSRGILVVEAAQKSGTFITVDHALDQGRDVFSVPGRITDLTSEGTNDLIRNGMAKAVYSVNDILEEYGRASAQKNIVPEIDFSKLDYNQSLICKLLQADERNFDELCEMAPLSVNELNSALTSLEFSGIIKQLPGRVYKI
jgi:DNA processing protein